MSVKITKQYSKSIYGDVISRVPMIFMVLTFALLFVSCAPHKKLAYEFVKNTKGASVAFYLPNDLEKNNIRKDCQPENLDYIEEEYVQARTKIVNKIDDEMFLDILISSFESTLEDYDLALEYWENENSMPDSLHWVVDLSHIEILEYIDNADLFVLCWSKNAADSEYVSREVERALQHAYPQVCKENATIKIYPLNIEPYADLPDNILKVYHYGFV